MLGTAFCDILVNITSALVHGISDRHFWSRTKKSGRTGTVTESREDKVL